jgi:dynein heavy chain
MIYIYILHFQEKMEDYLMEYNNMTKTPMTLVLFRYAVEHISRISRVLQQDNGHTLLAGVGGSGRTSCARLATSMCQYILYTIEITRTYSQIDWRDDLRNLLLRSGCDGRQTAFLLNDNQIKDESFLEDLSMLLNSGDVPNLYGMEEKAEIFEKMADVAREIQLKCPIPGKYELYKKFFLTFYECTIKLILILCLKKNSSTQVLWLYMDYSQNVLEKTYM